MKTVKTTSFRITKVVLIYCNIVSNDYQHDSVVLHAFVLYRSFQLLDILPKKLKTSNSELSYIEVWFTDQKSKLIEVIDKMNITLVIEKKETYKIDSLFNST